MKDIDPDAVGGRRRRLRRRITQMLVGGVAAAGVVGLTAAPAAAAQTCTGKPDSNLCLQVEGIGGNFFRVHVGIDVHMSLFDAQEYVDDPGVPFRVSIFGDDGGGTDQFLFDVPLTNLGASEESGLSGDFDITVSGSRLNEDPPGQEDEIRARVQLWDTDTNRLIKTYVSNQMSGNWS